MSHYYLEAMNELGREEFRFELEPRPVEAEEEIEVMSIKLVTVATTESYLILAVLGVRDVAELHERGCHCRPRRRAPLCLRGRHHSHRVPEKDEEVRSISVVLETVHLVE